MSEERMESMEDYVAELEASFKRVRVGDILTGTVISVTDTQVLLDLKSYAEGIIDKENLSNDPDFNVMEQVHKGDVIEATVVQTDDGAGNIVLSKKEDTTNLATDSEPYASSSLFFCIGSKSLIVFSIPEIFDC